MGSAILLKQMIRIFLLACSYNDDILLLCNLICGCCGYMTPFIIWGALSLRDESTAEVRRFSEEQRIHFLCCIKSDPLRQG